MGCTTWDRMPAWSMWELTMRRPPLRWKAFAAGGTRSASSRLRRPSGCSSVPMGEEAMARACACGNGNGSSSPMRPAWRSPCATCRRERANGTRLNIASLPGSVRTGAASRSPTTPSSSVVIAATTTEAGLTVQCQLDTNPYPTGRKISDEEMATLSLVPDSFHGEWNSTLRPRKTEIDTVIL